MTKSRVLILKTQFLSVNIYKRGNDFERKLILIRAATAIDAEGNEQGNGSAKGDQARVHRNGAIDITG